MINDNIQIWFAKNNNGEIVTIDEVDKTKEDNYYCPICGSELVPKMGEVMSWHFAHIDKSKCNNESIYHFWYKNKLLQPGDRFIIRADSDKEYICKEVLVEQTYKIGDKTYKPDLTVVCESGEVIYFEFDYTNKKKLQDYIDLWIELGNTVVEIDVKTLMNYRKDKLPVFKALWHEGKCFNIKKGEDELYYDTIGKHKESLFRNNNEEYNKEKEELMKLDWLWNDIKRYKIGEVDIEHISNLIQFIEGNEFRILVVNILKKANCHYIVKDYVNNIKNKVFNLFNNTTKDIKNITLEFHQAQTIYSRIYGINYFSLYYLNKCMYYRTELNKECFEQDIISRVNVIKNYNKSLKLFKTLKNYIENKYIKDENTYVNIEVINNPYLNYYGKYESKSIIFKDRLYLNNFPNQVYGEYITVPMCDKFEELELFIKIKLGDEFLNANKILKEADEKCNSLKQSLKYKLFFKYNRSNNLLTIRIKYNQYSRYIKITLSEFIKENNIGNEIDNKYLSMYEERKEYLLSEKLYKKINKIVNEIDFKYIKYVRGGWRVSNNYDNTIDLFKYDSKIAYVDKITTYDKNTKMYLEEKISNYIRNYIYGGKN